MQIMVTALEECPSESIVYAFLSSLIVLSALVFLGAQHRYSRNKHISPPLIKRKSSQVNIYIQIVLVTTKTFLDGYLLLSSRDFCNPLYQTIRLTTFLCLLVMLATFPDVDHYKATPHISCLIISYIAVFLEAIYKVFTFPPATIEQYLALIHLVVAFLLLSLACIIPYPLNPDNLESADYGTTEVKGNFVYRDGRPLTPEATASALKWISFLWMDSFIVAGYRRAPTPNDIYVMACELLSKSIYTDFESISRRIPYCKLWKQIYLTNQKHIWINFGAYAIELVAGYLSIYFQQQFIRYIEAPEGRPIQVAYGFVLGIFLVRVFSSFLRTLQGYSSQLLRYRTVTMLNIAIFSKTLRRKDMSGKTEKNKKETNDSTDLDGEKSDETSQSTSKDGKIVNLMSNDVWHIAYAIPNFDQYLFSPFDVCLTLLYLYNILGVASLVGCVFLVVLFPLNWIFARKISKTYAKRNEAEDKRTNLVNELLQGIRLIKYFAWETSWKEKVLQARRHEIRLHLLSYVYSLIVDAIVTAVPLLVAITSFLWYTKIAGNKLTASVAFTSVGLFGMLEEPLMQIPDFISSFSELKVCLNRISGFLDEPEIAQENYDEPIKVPEGIRPEDVIARVGFEESEFQWHCDTNSPVLSSSRSIDSGLDDQQFRLHIPAFNFPTGCLSIVCGPTGAGKSSFLSALLGEMDAISGRVYLPSRRNIASTTRIDPKYPGLFLDRVAYVCQRPFLQHDTIRNNILFGEPFEPVRYKKVIAQCALAADFPLWPNRDLTEIGEKGITLSGGQKQRISLARAVYSSAKTILLDDCLSAVDTHTARHINEKCINGDLLKGRTVILTTHHVHICLPSAQYLVKINRGDVIWHGTVEDARKTKELESLVGENVQLEKEQQLDEIFEENFEIGNKEDPTVKLVKDEEAAQGSINMNVYFFYLNACGGWLFWLIILAISVLIHGIKFSEDWWLRKWALAYDTVPVSAASVFSEALVSKVSNLYSLIPSFSAIILPERFGYLGFNKDVSHDTIQSMAQAGGKVQVDVDYYITVYALICAMQVFADMVDTFAITMGTLKGSMTLFEKLLHRVTNAPVRFFDTTPVGRLLNRFSKDMDVVDFSLGRDSSYIIRLLTGLAATTVIVSAITPEFIIVGLVAASINAVVGNLYIRISRELKRLNSVRMSPIYSLFSETLDGITTIRAYMQQDRFMAMIYKLQDTYMAPSYLLYAANRWLSIRFDIIGALLTLSASIFILWRIEDFDAGLAGISIFYAVNFSASISNLIRFYAELQVDLTAVERIQEYMQVEQEPPSIIEDHRPPAAWPTTAAIQVRNLEVRYTPEADPVLHSLNFDVRSHEKIGVVGRTGSGKSTLAMSFFRLVDATTGSITIDGIDIHSIGLQDLRSRITIIPQDAMLFSGTIRSNLDPFNEYTDQKLQESLQRVHLLQPHAETIHPETDVAAVTTELRYSITSLEQKVSDGGNNFSQGERQLLCMARALLRDSRLIIMDEATASVDFDMDARVQKTIRQEFKDTTLICIAHRLRTVIDYDRILVLNQGNIVEYDTPHNLISQPSLFRSMCEKSGELDVLVDMADQSSLQKNYTFQLPDDHSLTR